MSRPRGRLVDKEDFHDRLLDHDLPDDTKEEDETDEDDEGETGYYPLEDFDIYRS